MKQPWRLPADVVVYLLSLCTLFAMAARDMLHDELGRGDRPVDLRLRVHTPAM